MAESGDAKSKVALVKGDSRYDDITKALGLIECDIRLDKVKDILIKVNFVSTSRPVATTHVEGVRALLDFLRPRYDGPIAIAEAKKLIRTVERLPMKEAFDYAEEKINELFRSAEAAEGMSAFVTKREPRWVEKP